jgi:hypothetical protein
MGLYYMFHGKACYVSTKDGWISLSFKVVFNVDLMVFLSEYKRTPWCQNPKVHYRIHEIPATVPTLSHVNPLHTPPPNQPP